MAEKLKPWYPGWCKRPTFHDDYLTTFNRSNVTLIDTDGKGLDSYTASGIVVAGVEYKVDVLILATGYSMESDNRGLEDNLAAPIIGRNGRTFGEKWASQDVGTLFGIMTEGFPNLFFSKGTASPNLSSAYDLTARLIAHLIMAAMAETASSPTLIIEPKKEAEDAYTQEVEKRALWFSVLTTCTPGYFTQDGDLTVPKPAGEITRKSRTAPWGEGIVKYQPMIERVQEENRLDGFEITQ